MPASLPPSHRSLSFSKEATRVALCDQALMLDDVFRFVADSGAGAIDAFVGMTRAEHHPQWGELHVLEYSAYSEMAQAEMERLVKAAGERWPVRRVALLHRLGRCAVGEVSVVAAVSAAHREEAFAACRFLIDELKRTVPIWKKACFAHGSCWQ